MDTLAIRDETTFALLVSRHRRELWSHCFRLLGSYDDSEDLVQETLLRAWRGWPAFENRSTFRSWLYQIANNAWRNELVSRSRRPRLRGWPPAMDPALPAEVQPDAATCSRAATEVLMLLLVRRLPARQRVVLILRDVLGWSAKETAAWLRCSVPSANSLLQRARRTMRDQLASGAADQPGPSPQERALVRSYLAWITGTETPQGCE
ncbi:sigma-70 family RNA polymerase sigma factor family protein [Flindersiella endophytica]